MHGFSSDNAGDGPNNKRGFLHDNDGDGTKSKAQKKRKVVPKETSTLKVSTAAPQNKSKASADKKQTGS